MKQTGWGGVILVMVGSFVLGPRTSEGGALAQAARPVDESAALAAAVAEAAREAAPPVDQAAQQATQAGAAADAQTLASAGAKVSTTPKIIEKSGVCPEGMVEVEGDYCPYVEQKCLRWADPETKMRCAEFDPTPTPCGGKAAHKHFCVDRFEWPNKPGEKPIIMKSWYQARDACSSVGKRLCGDSEWTLACEGQERLPYPYGYARNSEACNIDKPHPDVNESAIANPATREAEVARLWQGEPSGTREACVSPYGVHDMTGNVDEWVVNEGGKPFKSGLKGGYWGPVRDRCRPMTVAHNEDFQFYQIGFRCCSEPSSSGDVAQKGGTGSGTRAATTSPPRTASAPSVLTGT